MTETIVSASEIRRLEKLLGTTCSCRASSPRYCRLHNLELLADLLEEKLKLDHLIELEEDKQDLEEQLDEAQCTIVELQSQVDRMKLLVGEPTDVAFVLKVLDYFAFEHREVLEMWMDKHTSPRVRAESVEASLPLRDAPTQKGLTA
jgi:hypothetical protein